MANRCRPYTDRCSTTHITTLATTSATNGVGTPATLPVASRCSVSKSRRVAEALRLVVGDEPRQAAIEEQAAQRDDERLQPQPRDQQTMTARRAARRARAMISTAAGQGRCHSVSMHRQQHAEQRERRADRQIDAAGDDDQAEPEAEDAERPDQARGVLQVRRATGSAG